MSKKERSLQDVCMDFVNKKSERSYVEAIKRLRPGLWRHLAKYESDFDSRNQILTEVFAKMWSKIHMYNPDKAYFSTWIYRVARNEALQHKRYTNRHTSYTELFENGSKTLIDASDVVMPDEFFDEKITEDPTIPLYETFMSRITTLDDKTDKNKYRDSLRMKFLEGKSYKEIAETLKIPTNTAKGNVLRGKAILKKLIEQEHPKLVSDFKKMIS